MIIQLNVPTLVRQLEIPIEGESASIPHIFWGCDNLCLALELDWLCEFL